MKQLIALAIGVLALLTEVHAQLDLSKRIELVGADGIDRQVLGLSDPVQLDAAICVDAARAQFVKITFTSGSDVLVGELLPVPTVISPGMLITVVTDVPNAANASIDLNGTGAIPILKWGGTPLDSADLVPAIPHQFIFDGAHYQLITNSTRPCPSGTMPGGSLYCIDQSNQGQGTFYTALNSCALRGGRLCSAGEWGSVCRRLPSFFATVVSAEWVDDAANNTGDAKTVGAGSDGQAPLNGISCEYGHTREPSLSYGYRCCFDR